MIKRCRGMMALWDEPLLTFGSAVLMGGVWIIAHEWMDEGLARSIVTTIASVGELVFNIRTVKLILRLRKQCIYTWEESFYADEERKL